MDELVLPDGLYNIVESEASGDVYVGAEVHAKNQGVVRLLHLHRGIEPVLAEMRRLGLRVNDSSVFFRWQRDPES